MTALRLSWLVLRNRVLQEGLRTYLMRVTVLAILNLLLLAAVFTTAHDRRLDLDLLADQYVYFVPLVALSGSVSVWEVELFAALGEVYLLRAHRLWTTRLLPSVAESITPFAFVLVLVILAGGPQREKRLITAVFMFVAFGMFEVAFGFCTGFRHEKSVNNFLNVITWVLGFGPGPFFGSSPTGYRVLFPGGLALRGDYVAEWARLGVVAIIAALLLAWGRRPRARPFFAR